MTRNNTTIKTYTYSYAQRRTTRAMPNLRVGIQLKTEPSGLSFQMMLYYIMHLWFFHYYLVLFFFFSV